MNKNDIARVALAVIVAGFAAVAITKVDISPNSAVARWVLFCAIAGVLMNSSEGMNFNGVLVGSLVCAAALTAAIVWLSILGKGVIPSFSGIELNYKKDPDGFIRVLSGCFIVSIIGVMAGSLARPATLNLLQTLESLDVEKAKNVERILRAIFGIFGAGALFLL